MFSGYNYEDVADGVQHKVDYSNNITTSEVHWIGGGEVTEEQIRFLVGSSGANDMIHEELSRMQQPRAHQENTNNITSTDEVHWIGCEEVIDEQANFLVGTGANDMLREELSLLQQPQVHQEDTSYPFDNQRKEVNTILEGVSFSFDHTPVVEVVLDEIVDSVVSQLSNQVSTLLSNETACEYQSQSIVKEETSITIPVPRFSVVDKSLHFALMKWSEDEADRLTNPLNNKRLMSREDYNDLCDSISRIHRHLQNTIKSDDERETVCGLEKLLNSGHITNDQVRAYNKHFNVG